MAEALTKLASDYGLAGLILGALFLYVWKVHVPSQKQSQKFIEGLVETAKTESAALIKTFREDVKDAQASFLSALQQTEDKHAAGMREIAQAIRDGSKNGSSH